MVDDSTHGTSTDDSRLSRRGYLVAAGGLGTGLAGGYAGYHRLLEQRSDDESSPLGDPPGPREDFLWLGGSLWRDDAVRENLFAFARRHDLAVALVKTHSDENPLDENLEPLLTAASEFDLEVWLNVGLLNDLPAEEFVTDADARERHLDRLREVARVHGELFDTGRIILWQEAPVMGEWVEGGDWNEAAVENLIEFGPEIFDAQKRAIEGANDALDVGPFVHFPYIVDSKRSEVFDALARGLRRRNADPDFGFVDFYRGWYEKDVGPERADDAVRSLVSNTREALERPVFYLGQCHTVNPNHTPSKQAMRMNLRASIEAGAAGLSWYVRSGYEPTESGFDPFVPNVEGAELEGDSINTLTIARDRFLYPWLATLESGDGFEADEAFDLWLLGDGFDFYDHRLSVRTADGDGDETWEYVGDFGGYAEGDYPDGSEATDRATVFRGLDRDRLLTGGALECRVETTDRGSSAELQSALVMPCETDAYVSEREAAAFARGDAPLEECSLGRVDERTALEPGSAQQLAIPVDGGGASLERLRHPDHLESIRRLASFEERETVDPSDHFDLWLRGSDLAEPSAVPSIFDADGTERSPAAVGVVASTDELAVCYGLERDRFLGADGIGLRDDTDATVAAAYAMPYAGRAAFRSPARAADLLAEQPGEAETFSLEYVELE
ncbi:hypothetical protein [Natronorubrum sp. FCH18a]|uniref:hypothetical protein n=1 Tax=Natronorubrum sp. FCH18a TaxID=3447018 RepID=UPI003F50F147